MELHLFVKIIKWNFFKFHTNIDTNYMNILQEGFVAYLLHVMLAVEFSA